MLKRRYIALLLATAAPAAGAAPEWPAGIVLPWETPGIDPDRRRRLASSMEAALEQLAAGFLQEVRTFSERTTAAGIRLPLNAARMGRAIRTGPLRQPVAAGGRILQPVLCSVADHDFVQLQLADRPGNRLLAAVNTALPRDGDPAALEQLLNSGMPGLARRLQTVAAARQPPPASALHVDLLAGRETGRADEGSALCLNDLLRAALAPTMTVLRGTGNRHLGLMRRWLPDEKLTRATRRLTLIWQARTAPVLPRTWELEIRTAEGVFAAGIRPARRGTVRLEPGAILRLVPPDPLLQFLNGEARALAAADPPAITHIFGAWAYLDRGRAWGLQMNDRLIHEAAGNVIKGHVVGFYGPGFRLQSPRKFPVHEGAILYIRKGLAAARKGQTFVLDPTTYPTAWPPVPTPTPADKAR